MRCFIVAECLYLHVVWVLTFTCLICGFVLMLFVCLVWVRLGLCYILLLVVWLVRFFCFALHYIMFTRVGCVFWLLNMDFICGLLVLCFWVTLGLFWLVAARVGLVYLVIWVVVVIVACEFD